MGFYAEHIEPRLIDAVCGLSAIAAQRAEIVPRARGRVLELGSGSGYNATYYDPGRVERVWALDPSSALRERGAGRIAAARVPVEQVAGVAEEVPFDDRSVDTVVITYTLCTLPDVPRALRAARSVLKPTGELLFCEHGRAPEEAVARWQDRLDGLWSRIAGGCHLNRDVVELLRAGGFAVVELEAEYLPRTPRLLGFHRRGVARPA